MSALSNLSRPRPLIRIPIPWIMESVSKCEDIITKVPGSGKWEEVWYPLKLAETYLEAIYEELEARQFLRISRPKASRLLKALREVTSKESDDSAKLEKLNLWEVKR